MKTIIDYEAGRSLSYTVEVIFPKILTDNECLKIDNIIRYWGNIPYISQEGIYNTKWFVYYGVKQSKVIISIDFTKSASDDYIAREPLEKLANWVKNGTPIRKSDGLSKEIGIGIEPISVKTDYV